MASSLSPQEFTLLPGSSFLSPGLHRVILSAVFLGLRGVSVFAWEGVGPSPLSAAAALPSDQLPLSLWPLFPTAPEGTAAPGPRQPQQIPSKFSPLPPLTWLCWASASVILPTPVSCSPGAWKATDLGMGWGWVSFALHPSFPGPSPPSHSFCLWPHLSNPGTRYRGSGGPLGSLKGRECSGAGGEALWNRTSRPARFSSSPVNSVLPGGILYSRTEAGRAAYSLSHCFQGQPRFKSISSSLYPLLPPSFPCFLHLSFFLPFFFFLLSLKNFAESPPVPDIALTASYWLSTNSSFLFSFWCGPIFLKSFLNLPQYCFSFVLVP